MNTQKTDFKHKVSSLIAKLIKIELPRADFRHPLAELEASLFERDYRRIKSIF